MKKNIETNWYPEKRLVVTHIIGDLDIADIEKWEESFINIFGKIQDETTFKIFVNMHGFKALNLDVHKRFRTVIPLTLANYGWKVGYVDLFEEEAKKIQYRHTRGIKCVAAAHSHKDETKMNLYETRFSNHKEHYFIDPNQARQWIENLEITD